MVFPTGLDGGKRAGKGEGVATNFVAAPPSQIIFRLEENAHCDTYEIECFLGRALYLKTTFSRRTSSGPEFKKYLRKPRK